MNPFSDALPFVAICGEVLYVYPTVNLQNLTGRVAQGRGLLLYQMRRAFPSWRGHMLI